MTTEIALSKLEQQYLLEEEMRDAGITRYVNLMQEAKEDQLETATDAGLQLLKRSIEPLIAAIKIYLQQEEEKSRGRKTIATQYLTLLEPEIVAFLTAKSVLNAVTSQVSLIKASLHVATTIEDELRLRFYQAENSGHYNAVYQRIQNKNSYDYKRTVLMHSMGKIGLVWEPWSKTNKVHLGTLCIDLMAQSTGYIEIVSIPKRVDDQGVYVVPTQAALDWLEKEHQRCALLAPTYLPMVVSPKPWTTPFDGGYQGVLADSLKLVVTHNPKYLDELAHIEMPEVYQAVNHIQATPWQVNSRVLDVAQSLWNSHSELAGLPARDDLKPQPCPIPKGVQTQEMTQEQQTVFYAWKRQAAQTYDDNITNRSKRLMVSKILYVADKFREEPEVYFPHNLDFRGRVYPIANFLNPQGNDFAKGLLTFAHGKPLGNETAARWLAIHGANVYGKDKQDFEGRVSFIQSFTPTIQAIADDPLTNLEWIKAKKPWQFLAFCFEWSGYMREGLAFVSRIPIALDGTCNGLQHFSAMLRDEIGGAAVNLIPSDKPQDIYQRVADVVIEKLKQDESELAKQWLTFGVTRDITKRPVMILPYGGTRLACRSYIEEHMRKCLHEGQCNVFSDGTDDHIFQASQFLSGVIWEAIGEVVVAAREIMGWLKKAARLVSNEGLPIQWVAPSGFPVQQAYFDVKSRRIKTQLSGNVIRKIYLCMNETLDTLNKNEQANGISPNFVHSMDAGMLHLYVNRAKMLGIDAFSLIHDSYGTLAADTELSAACIRQVFIQVYRDDVLNSFRCDLLRLLSDQNVERLPALPSQGQLNLERIEQSAFFFA